MQAVSILRDFTAEVQGVLKGQPRHWQMKLRQQMIFVWISPLGVPEVSHTGLVLTSLLLSETDSSGFSGT